MSGVLQRRVPGGNAAAERRGQAGAGGVGDSFYESAYTGSQPTEFDWDFANLDHIARYKIEPEEAEEAVTDPAAVLANKVHRGPQGQRRIGIIGTTEAGRVLFVVLEPRRGKVRVVTALNASSEQRDAYYSEE
ncbi:hypothetical protein DAETH_31340 [Deinococcus aetherius]|uniref:BrnT family toxin n=1 Tax=Deinococcus aetherius TaxID=200252 RepID=A0ABM8AH90_9DEIO|nr:hypothetical protein DAETH_31340 [Deinococcus aetherius]